MTLETSFCINTPRLNLHYLDPTNDSHCDFFVDLIISPKTLAGNKQMRGEMRDRETARAAIERGADRIVKTGYGRYAISLKSFHATDDLTPGTLYHGGLIGLVSMQLDRFPGAPTVPDIGFSLLAEHYGKGYATEAAHGLLTYFENVKRRTEFAGFCDPDNEGSKKVLRRLGFKEQGVRELSGVASEERKLSVLVWTKGLKNRLDEYRM